MQPMLNLAVKAARRAGDVIFRNLNRVQNLEVKPKGKNDFVTEIDHLAEQEIIGTIRQSYPNHGFLAEESGRSGDETAGAIVDSRWIASRTDVANDSETGLTGNVCN